jgi:hypothetical protein
MISKIEIEQCPELDRELPGIDASRKEHRHANAYATSCFYLPLDGGRVSRHAELLEQRN